MRQRLRARSDGSAALMALIILGGLVLAAANVAVFLLIYEHPDGSVQLLSLRERYALCPACFIYLTAAPVIFTVLVAFLVGRRKTPAAVAPVADTAPTPPPPPSSDAALRLLSLLQQEGRFLDFISEDLSLYSDEEVGAAARTIQEGCRKAVRERIELERVLADDDGSPVQVDPGFDPARIRLTGNVTGDPPFRGTLQHGGWRAAKVTLPESPGGVDPHILAPAEVEIS